MTVSIKRYLLANLMVGILFATSLAIVSNLYLGYKSIRPHLDAQMIVMAYSINTFLTEDVDNETVLTRLHKKTAEYVHEIHDVKYDNKSYLQSLHNSLDNIQFRVYNTHNKLIAKSPKAPKTPMYEKTGFYKHIDNQAQWRLFNLHNKQGERIVVMQPYENRLFIEKRANSQAISIILLTILPLGCFLWIIIGRSLDSIDQTTSEIKSRAHNNLQPIPTKTIPIEIMPLIIELNSLFARLHDNFIRESRFAGDAAHELKTPLAALKTHAQVAKEHNKVDEIKREINKVLQGVDRANHTVDQLLILSRTMPDAYTKDHKKINIAHITTQILADLTPYALKKNIKLSFDNLTTKNSIILGHSITFGILIRNLVDNAIRYSPENSNIEVILEKKDKNFHLHVIDQGPGISKDLQERVFERFYRVVGNSANGSGLGLNIAKQIVILHSGKIKLKSNEKNKTGLHISIIIPKAKV